MTISELANNFIIEQKVKSREVTVKYYEEQIRAILRYFENRDVESITKNDLLLFIKYMRDNNSKQSTANARCKVLKRIIRYGIDEQIINVNNQLTKVLNYRLPKNDTKHYNHLNDLQIQELFDYIEKLKNGNNTDFRNYVMICLFLDTGVRRTELSLLKIKNVDFKNKKIYLDASKTGSNQFLPLTPYSDILLRDLIKINEKNQKSSKYLFIDYDTGKQLKPSSISTIFKRMSKELTFQVSPHVLRHTFATKLANKLTPFELRDLMRHTNVTTTNIYVGMSNEEKLQENASNNSILSGKIRTLI